MMMVRKNFFSWRKEWGEGGGGERGRGGGRGNRKLFLEKEGRMNFSSLVGRKYISRDLWHKKRLFISFKGRTIELRLKAKFTEHSSLSLKISVDNGFLT